MKSKNQISHTIALWGSSLVGNKGSNATTCTLQRRPGSTGFSFDLRTVFIQHSVQSLQDPRTRFVPLYAPDVMESLTPTRSWPHSILVFGWLNQTVWFHGITRLLQLSYLAKSGVSRTQTMLHNFEPIPWIINHLLCLSEGIYHTENTKFLEGHIVGP